MKELIKPVVITESNLENVYTALCEKECGCDSACKESRTVFSDEDNDGDILF